MKIITTFLFVLLMVTCFGQITVTHPAPKAEIINTVPYDSVENFLGDSVYQYVGQDLYLNEKDEEFRRFGYEGFTKDMLKDNVYKCCQEYNSKYDELAKKYFTVLQVIRHPRATEKEELYGHAYFLKLLNKSNKDTVYYSYDTQYGFKFPFIVVGYFAKLKQTLIGQKYTIDAEKWGMIQNDRLDINTGKPISDLNTVSTWKCVDVTIESKQYLLALVLQNEKNEHILIPLKDTNESYYIWTSN